MIRARRQLLTFAVLATLIASPAASTARPADLPPIDTPHGALARLQQAEPGLRHHVAGYLGTFDSVQASPGRVLVADEVRARAEDRAYAFLAEHGAAAGMSPAERARPRASLAINTVRTDPVTGVTHVKLDQVNRGRPVVGAQLIVHMTSRGITGFSGVFVPGISVPAKPAVGEQRAIARAIRTADVEDKSDLHVHDTALQIYHDGLIAQTTGTARLAWMIALEGAGIEEEVWVDATTRRILNRISQVHAAKDRCAYLGHYDPEQPDAFVVRREGDPSTELLPTDNLFRFSGHVYDIFKNAFGYDSWDGQGGKMRTVYFLGLVETINGQLLACPNAYWSSSQKITRYCPGFDLDDVVAHEWGHAYTDSTHDLIYQMQPGALNEAYSDIWGEVVDILNGEDELVGGSNNEEPYPNGTRWILGEGLTDEAAGAIALRDLWDPARRNQPAKVSDANYTCDFAVDAGGVHFNSSIPGHAFAMLTDGKTYNGQTVEGIGMDKAAHIYWQAAANYQTRTSGFAQHAEALAAACNDLIGIDPNGLTTGQPIGDPITAGDCEQVDKVMLASEMADPPAACGGPLLKAGAPGPCLGATTLLSEDWEDGLAGWTLASEGTQPTWPGYEWAATTTLPDGRAGKGAFAANEGDPSSCRNTTPDVHSGKFSITGPDLVAPSGAESIQVRFDHWVATEPLDDGGNLMISVNGGPFVALAGSDYLYNGPNAVLRDNSGPAETDNPKKGQQAFTGGDANVLTGTWGTSVVDVAGYVEDGDTFALRFEFGQDCVIGATGWYLDDVLVTVCPIAAPPGLALGDGYTEPDDDGSYTLELTRPDDAIGPEDIEEAALSAPTSIDDAEDGLSGWTLSETGGADPWRTSSDKPMHDSTAFHAPASEISTGVAASMTTVDPIAIPATGEALLSFDSWHSNHAGDLALVEASADGGDTWSVVFNETTPTTLTGGVVATPVTQYVEFATEALERRSVSLADFAGQSVHLRFRFQHGATLYVNVARLGWYVDNIELSHIDWQPLTTTSSPTYDVTGRAAGTYLYRARTTYSFGQSGWSEIVTATVA